MAKELASLTLEVRLGLLICNLDGTLTVREGISPPSQTEHFHTVRVLVE